MHTSPAKGTEYMELLKIGAVFQDLYMISQIFVTRVINLTKNAICQVMFNAFLVSKLFVLSLQIIKSMSFSMRISLIKFEIYQHCRLKTYLKKSSKEPERDRKGA